MRRHKNTNLKKPPKMIETIPYISENIKIIRELLEENKKILEFYSNKFHWLYRTRKGGEKKK